MQVMKMSMCFFSYIVLFIGQATLQTPGGGEASSKELLVLNVISEAFHKRRIGPS